MLLARVNVFYSEDAELEMGDAPSSIIRAIGLNLNDKTFPFVVQFNTGQAYRYSCQHIADPQSGIPISTEAELLALYDTVLRGGYTKAQLKAGIPGKRPSTGALVSSLFVNPTRGKKDLYERIDPFVSGQKVVRE